jgi:hypothetical protein
MKRLQFLCAPEGDPAGAGGAPPPPKDPPPAPPAAEKKEPPKEDASGPVATLAQDMARVKKKIGLDEPPPGESKKDSGGLWFTRLFE